MFSKPASTPSYILFKSHGDGVVELCLNRPKALNALNGPMFLEAAAAINKYSASKSVRIIIFTALGSTFCSGMDVFEASKADSSLRIVDAARQFMQALLECPHILMAAVFGHVVGIGVTMLLHFDVVLAHPYSQFETPFSSVGVTPEFASSVLFPMFLGNAITSRLLLRGERVTASTLERAGVLQIVQANVTVTTVGYALSWSRDVNDDQWSTLKVAKRLIRDPIRRNIRAALQAEFDAIKETHRSGTLPRLMKARVAEMEEAKKRAKL